MTATVLPLPPAFAKSRALRPLLEQASEWAEDQLAKFDWPVPVSFEWHRIANNFQDELVGLQIRGGKSTAHGVFSRNQLTNELAFRTEFLAVLSELNTQTLDRIRTDPAPTTESVEAE